MNQPLTGPGATPADQTSTSNPSQSVTDAPLTLAQLDAYFGEFRSKINGEVASLRRHVKGAEPAEPAQAATPATLEDIRLSREVGRLEAELGDGILSSLGEDYNSASVGEQMKMLRLAKNLSSTLKPVETMGHTSQARGETPLHPISAQRGQVPIASSGVPRTKAEFIALKKKDPRAAHELYSNPSFDPTSLR